MGNNYNRKEEIKIQNKYKILELACMKLHILYGGKHVRD